VTLRPDDEHLDRYERWARDRLEHLEPRFGQLRVTDRKGGPPGMHDFEADGPAGPVAAIEVTSVGEPGRLSVESEITKRGLSSFPLPGLTSRWLVRLTDNAQVRDASRPDKLRPLLSDLEAQGVRYAHDRGDYRDQVVIRLRELSIAAVYTLGTSLGGGVVMGTDAYGAIEWDGPAVDAWLDEFVASDLGVSKLAKLGRARPAERHLVIVLDSFSQPGMGIPLNLSSRHDEGAADYVMPSCQPADPLTHLWLLPMAGCEGLRWTRGSQWAILAR
jgi:hypothetical protein